MLSDLKISGVPLNLRNKDTFPKWDDIIDGEHIKIVDNSPFWNFRLGGGQVANLDDLKLKEDIILFKFQISASEIFRLYEGNKTHLEDFLQLTPFYLDNKFVDLNKFLPGINGELRALCFFRLAEIFLRLLDLYKQHFGVNWQFRTVRILLLRQRFRYLSSLYHSEDIKHWISDYEGLIKLAHHEYADVFINQQDEFHLAFAAMEHDGKPWNLDHEAELLVFDLTDPQRKKHIWNFVLHDDVSQNWIDLILRKWFLAHNDICKSNSVVGTLVIDLVLGEMNTLNQNMKAANERSFIWTDKAKLLIHEFFANTGRLYSLLPLLFGFSAYLAVIFLCLGWAPGLLVCVAIGLLTPSLGIIFFMWRYRGIFPNQLLYPFALRIPAMSMVGVFGVIGLVDPMVEFGYNCFEQETLIAAIIIIAGTLLLSLLYIMFEVVFHTRNKERSLRRSAYIFSYAYGVALWISIFTAWVADAVGIINQNAEAITRGINFVITRGALSINYSLSFDFVMFISALALLLGVFTQIFWEEKSISEPL